MDSVKTFDSIPNDLFREILSRLPTKSIARCRCVSKLWASILCHQDFTELFLTKSSARPRLLFAVETASELFFYSSPQSQNPSLVVDFHMKFQGGINQYKCSFANGLIYVPVPDLCVSKATVCVLCNPTTGRYVSLPELDNRRSRSFLGFDPIGKQFKVLFMNRNDEWVYHILTLGTEKLRWRKIQCPLIHEPSCQSICINGVLYYLARRLHVSSLLVVCFDVRSEKFKFIDEKRHLFGLSTELINYKGKLGGASLEYDNDGEYPCELCVGVLEDVEKQEWSKYVYSLPKIKLSQFGNNISVVGMTAAGEIVISEIDTSTCTPFYVFYFNPERNTLQSVNIQGFGVGGNYFGSSVYTFVDYIEDLNVNDLKQLKSKPQQPQHTSREQGRRTSRELCNSAPSIRNKQTVIPLQNKYELLADLE